jgi:hypothetical protein
VDYQIYINDKIVVNLDGSRGFLKTYSYLTYILLILDVHYR